MPDDPLILTAAFDADSAPIFQGLRDRHFPAERNIVPAHLTLFHHLPGGDCASVLADLRTLADSVAPVPFTTAAPRFLGRGCALTIVAAELEELRAALAARWRGWLNAQDRQPFRPHVTVQNKVAPASARALCDALAGLPTVTGRIEGLDLWFYRGGPWQLIQRIDFAGPDRDAEASRPV